MPHWKFVASGGAVLKRSGPGGAPTHDRPIISRLLYAIEVRDHDLKKQKPASFWFGDQIRWLFIFIVILCYSRKIETSRQVFSAIYVAILRYIIWPGN